MPPTSARTWSTTGVDCAGSVFWPSQVPPADARGSTTGVTSPLNWFFASQVTVPRSSRKPPAWASTCWATARSESTLAAVEAPCVATTSYTPLAVCVRSAATRSSTSVRASSAKALLCQALTPPTVMPVAATHAVANATTLVLMSHREGPLPFVRAARCRPPGRTSAGRGRL